jgi:ribulose-5-phosphate 4-epimerase/fuculose-1-phosphate aldolase
MRLNRLRAELAATVRTLAAAGLWSAGASASARDGRTGWRVVTPHAFDPAAARAGDMIVVSAAGERLEGLAQAAIDAIVHLRVYAAVPDAGALVLARPPLASALADEARHLPPVSRRLARLGGGVRCVPYAPAGSEALARLVADALSRRAACLIAARGAMARGPTAAAAAEAMALLERVGGAYAATVASGYLPRRLAHEEMVRAVRYGGRPLHPRGADAERRSDPLSPGRGG